MSEVIRKALAQIEPGADDATSEHGTFRVILSDDTLDRDGESLKAGEWITPLPEHITFDIDHAMNVAGTVGSGTPSIGGDGKMYVDGSYSSRPLAQEVRSLVNEGHIRTTSVAFLRKKDQKSGTTRRELLNGAFVAVPANPNAVILASKAFDPDHDGADVKVGARNSGADAERLQKMHDLAVENGAACNCDAPDGKALADGLRRVANAGRHDAEAARVLKAAAEAVAEASETEDETPNEAIASVDAVIDQAIALIQGVDTSALPANVQQALALLTAADETVDDLMEDQGIPDPDEDGEKALNDDELFVKAHLIALRAAAV